MIISIGVDVGLLNGAIAIINSDLKILELTKAPFYKTEVKSKRLKPKLNKETGMYEKDYKKHTWTDFKALKDIYKPYLNKGEIIYTVEKVFTRPNEGEINSFRFGNSLGIHQAYEAYIDPVAFYNPTPNVWKKDLGVTSDKETSIKLAEKLFEIDLRDYLKKGKVDDIAEALLLSYYGIKQYLTENGERKKNGNKSKNKKE